MNGHGTVERQQLLNRILVELDFQIELARTNGRSRKKLAAALGVNRKVLSTLRTRSSLDVALWGRLMEVLQLDPTVFIQLAAHPRALHPLRRFARQAELLKSEPPELVSRVDAWLKRKARCSGDWWLLTRSATHKPTRTASSATIQGIEELDRFRYDRPKYAVRELESIGCQVIDSRRPDAYALVECLGAYASAHRMLGHLEVAHHALATTVKLVEWFNLAQPRADIAKRAISLAVYEGHAELAREIASWLLEYYGRRKNNLGMGRALIALGDVQLHLGEFEPAARSYRKSLDHLPPSNAWFRRASLFALGVCYIRLGKPRRAKDYLAKARALIGKGERYANAMVDWLLGHIAKAQADPIAAASHYQRCCANLAETGQPFALILASLDLAEAYLAAGDAPRVVELATSMRRFYFSLSRYRIVCNAIRKLDRAALEGSVSLKLLHHVRREVERGSRHICAPPPGSHV